MFLTPRVLWLLHHPSCAFLNAFMDAADFTSSGSKFCSLSQEHLSPLQRLPIYEHSIGSCQSGILLDHFEPIIFIYSFLIASTMDTTLMPSLPSTANTLRHHHLRQWHRSRAEFCLAHFFDVCCCLRLSILTVFFNWNFLSGTTTTTMETTVKPRTNGCQGTNQFHLFLADFPYYQYRR